MLSKIFITWILLMSITDITKIYSGNTQGVVLFLYIVAIILLWGD